MNPIPNSPSVSMSNLETSQTDFCITISTKDGLDDVHFSRADYLKNLNLPTDSKFSNQSAVVQKLVQIFRQFHFLPKIWTSRQTRIALDTNSTVLGQLDQRFKETLTIGLYGDTKSQWDKDLKLLQQGKTVSIDNIRIGFVSTVTTKPWDSLYTRFFFGESCPFLRMPDGTSLNKLYSDSALLASHVAEVLNSAQCIEAQVLNSDVWLEWFCQKSNPPQDYKQSGICMHMASLLYKVSSFDLVVAALNGGWDILGVATWANQHKYTACNLILVSSSTDQKTQNFILFDFLKKRYQINNLNLTNIVGRLDSEDTWLKVYRAFKNTVRISLLDLSRRQSFYGDIIFEYGDLNTITKLCANYLNSSTFGSLVFCMHRPLTSNDMMKTKQIWIDRNFKALTAINSFAADKKTNKIIVVFAKHVSITHSDLIYRLFHFRNGQAPHQAPAATRTNRPLSLVGRKRPHSFLSSVAPLSPDALTLKPLFLPNSLDIVAAGPKLPSQLPAPAMTMQVHQMPPQPSSSRCNADAGSGANQDSDIQLSTLTQNLTPMPKQTDFPHHLAPSIDDILNQYPDLEPKETPPPKK